MTGIYASLAGVVLLVVCAALTYRGLLAARTRAEETWHEVELRLEARQALVPELLQAVRRHAPDDAEVTGRLERARAAAAAAHSPLERADAERRLVAAMLAVGGLVSGHPSLGGQPEFVELEQRLLAADEALRAARRVHNADVRLYLSRRRRIPGPVLAALGSFPERPYFELDHTRDRGAAVVLAA